MKNKKYKNILFDLDGTLVFGDVDYFFKLYLSELSKKYLKVFGGDAKQFVSAFETALDKFTYNDGSKTNSEVFYDCLSELSGVDKKSLGDFFDDFYMNEFKKTHMTYDPIPEMIECLEFLHKAGYNIVLATDSMFTREAVDFKLFDCGIKPELFSYITTIDNCSFSKVTVDYYTALLKKLDMKASETLMVGNHAIKDNNALKCGIDTILISDYIINKTNLDVKNTMTIKEFSDYVHNEF